LYATAISAPSSPRAGNLLGVPRAQAIRSCNTTGGRPEPTSGPGFGPPARPGPLSKYRTCPQNVSQWQPVAPGECLAAETQNGG